ncbi:hypothetical protein BaRGS_00022620 [Batillaria attramentaria]|uniref:Uncharacterized protein n=1 Tax=Batillaria attramentaria TaxID=370345 RepID=A0ABD0KG55_9CAEN
MKKITATYSVKKAAIFKQNAVATDVIDLWRQVGVFLPKAISDMTVVLTFTGGTDLSSADSVDSDDSVILTVNRLPDMVSTDGQD